MRKKLNCPYCGESFILKNSPKEQWIEKAYTCKTCLMPFWVFADRRMDFFFVDRYTKPLLRAKPFLAVKIK